MMVKLCIETWDGKVYRDAVDKGDFYYKKGAKEDICIPKSMSKGHIGVRIRMSMYKCGKCVWNLKNNEP